jgi:hypothetical protein
MVYHMVYLDVSTDHDINDAPFLGQSYRETLLTNKLIRMSAYARNVIAKLNN